MATSKKTPKPAAAKKTAAKKAPAKKAGAKKDTSKKAPAKKKAAQKQAAPKKAQSFKDKKAQLVALAADDFIDREELARLADKTQSIIVETQHSAEEIVSEMKSFLTDTVIGAEKKISFWRRILGIKAK
jgi:hypothetical protein